jgi:hypothetical protein
VRCEERLRQKKRKIASDGAWGGMWSDLLNVLALLVQRSTRLSQRRLRGGMHRRHCAGGLANYQSRVNYVLGRSRGRRFVDGVDLVDEHGGLVLQNLQGAGRMVGGWGGKGEKRQ